MPCLGRGGTRWGTGELRLTHCPSVPACPALASTASVHSAACFAQAASAARAASTLTPSFSLSMGVRAAPNWAGEHQGALSETGPGHWGTDPRTSSERRASSASSLMATV